MENYWQQLIALIMAPTLVVGAVAWLLRSLLDQGMKRDLEKFKIELERESFEKKQQFSLIHQTRADVIAEFYGKLIKTRAYVNDLVGILQQGDSHWLKKRKKCQIYTTTLRCTFIRKKYFSQMLQRKNLIKFLKNYILH